MEDSHFGEAEGEHVEKVGGVGYLYRVDEDGLVKDLERVKVLFKKALLTS